MNRKGRLEFKNTDWSSWYCYEYWIYISAIIREDWLLMVKIAEAWRSIPDCIVYRKMISLDFVDYNKVCEMLEEKCEIADKFLSQLKK